MGRVPEWLQRQMQQAAEEIASWPPEMIAEHAAWHQRCVARAAEDAEIRANARTSAQ